MGGPSRHNGGMTQVRRSAAILGGLMLLAAPVGAAPVGPAQPAARAISPLAAVDRPELELAAAAGPAVRSHVALRLDPPSAVRPAWQRFRDSWGARWTATWDASTGVPSRLWGPGIAWPGA